MAQTNVMDVQVKQLTKFGFQNDKDEYIGWSKNLKDGDKAQVVPGRSFSVEMYIADSGKQYVNKVIRQLDSLKSGDTSVVIPATTRPPTVKPLVTPKSANSEVMSKSEWADKDTRISRQGAIQAAVKAASAYSTDDLLFTNAVALADKMLAYVNNK